MNYRYEEQVRMIQQNDAKIATLTEKLNNIKVQNKGLTPQTALHRITEELNTTKYLVLEKYPKVQIISYTLLLFLYNFSCVKDITLKSLYLRVLQNVVAANSISGDSLKQLEKEVLTIQEEIGTLPTVSNNNGSVLDQK